MREFDHIWPRVGTTGGQEALEVTGDGIESAWYVEASTGATNTIAIQSARASTGPWFTEGSTALAAGVGSVMRISGPFGWVRVHATTTGAIVRGIIVS